ncbi:MAG: 50S ribosomal protein L5 [Bacteroidetes bacterium]|nr:50S ribosomal protein L5 [Bacteroidota bacterium]MBX7046410.1 50S ribosomal protein L5 [Ignavibacteria bacterium]
MAKTKQDRKKDEAANKKAKGGEQSKKADENFVEEKVPIRLKTAYNEKVVPELVKKFSYKNKMQAPKLEKICLNMGVGDAVSDSKLIDVAVRDMEAIVGQKPSVVKARKSVSNFKLREGMNIGVRVTLRNARMYEFLDRFINIAVPRIRDFKGLGDRSFDGRGNYSIGIKEQVIFPEINVDNITKVLGMDITFVTSAKTDEEAYALLKEMGLPFVNRKAS